MANREIQRAWEKFIQNGATREQWKYKLALWRLKKEQADQDQASAKTGPSKACRPDLSCSGLRPAKAQTSYRSCS
jgi:hypothetical protein